MVYGRIMGGNAVDRVRIGDFIINLNWVSHVQEINLDMYDHKQGHTRNIRVELGYSYDHDSAMSIDLVDSPSGGPQATAFWDFYMGKTHDLVKCPDITPTVDPEVAKQAFVVAPDRDQCPGCRRFRPNPHEMNCRYTW
jgi:hypothetical protein